MAAAAGKYDDPAIEPVAYFKHIREPMQPQARLKLVRQQAQKFREEMLRRPKVVYYQSFDLVRVPYPTKYAYLNAYTGYSQFLHILNRMFVVQFNTKQGLKTLLVSPSDLDGNRATPFFKRLSDGFPGVPGFPVVKDYLQSVVAPIYGTVQHWLAQIGLDPADVDYITYDHLHTQELRGWLGTGSTPGFFPNAKLLVTRQEWESTKALLPPQAEWYCPNGIAGIDERKVILLDDDVWLGDGVALVQTTGHTEGNHSIVCHTDEGLLVTSENGIGSDSYTPHRSTIPGLAEYAHIREMEVILNGNTLERGLDQYLSMVLEKEIAGPSVRNTNFPNIMSSSENSAFWLFPNIKPAFEFGTIKYGRFSKPEDRVA
eukprot:TRINITY_DN1827_c0_g1_i1.p2 TRINITY_DN1827_c0_g1~~TRINITY_DN1827_c0_g1_i1.p2  ORF type:complete len:386 (+),score=101.71 TRINITY_DN1827_c0_g1_i1:44-1159(+)